MTCPVTGANPPGGTRIVLDPLVQDLAGESAALRAAGPLVEVELPGGVPVWAVTRHAEARALLTDPRLVKDIAHWDAFTRGEIAADWPLIGLANPGRSMLTVDGEDHRRLRALVAQALTPRRVEHLRERIEELTAGLLDRVSEAAGRSEVIDLKAEFAYLLPMYVVGELMGIDEADLPRLKVLFEKFFSTQTPPEEVLATLGELAAMMARTVATKRADPGDDLTSALILASESGDHLTDEEIVGTLQLMMAAGHETTISLIVNAVVNLCSHPEQLALVLDGKATWDAVVEETLRYSTPTSHDEAQHGPDAGDFDVTRDPIRHISFGHGPHVCPGAALSRLEAGIALPALFERFPDLTLAVPAGELRNKPVVTQNDLYELPVRVGG
jgi:cytochrome P450